MSSIGPLTSRNFALWAAFLAFVAQATGFAQGGPDLIISKNHPGNFFQGQSGALYGIVIFNAGSAPTNGMVTVIDTLPQGLTLASIGGDGWSCLGTICTRSDVLGPNLAYPVLNLLVNVDAGAATNLVNTVEVSGGGDVNTGNNVASDATFIRPGQGQNPNLTFYGSMPHLASAGTWETFFTLVNLGGTTSDARLNLYSDNGTPLALPFGFAGAPLSSVERNLASGASVVLNTTGPDTTPVNVGSAHLLSNGNIQGFAVFRWKTPNQEAVVPLETRDSASYLLPYDNTNGVDLGVAIANVSDQIITVNVIVRDDNGQQIFTRILQLAAHGHESWVLRDKISATEGGRGTVEFQPPPGARISVLGVRFTPPGTLTTIPVLADVAFGAGGSMAHVASGGGWKTSIVLVNTGENPANATLRFYDDAGNPLTLPLNFPQLEQSTNNSTFQRNIAQRSTFLVESEAPANIPVKVGSIQVLTDGQVGGFVVFRYQPNGQEAVVPLETRDTGSFVIAFDNTAGVSTGVAISNATAQAKNVQVLIRDEHSQSFPAAPLNLPGNGHTSFVLADKYPVTSGRRGTIEFVISGGGKINALGIRTTVPQLTFTTLPALVR